VLREKDVEVILPRRGAASQEKPAIALVRSRPFWHHAGRIARQRTAWREGMRMSGTWRGWAIWLAVLLLRGVPVGLLLGFAGHFALVLLGDNFRTVLPGKVYRSGQPSPAQLRRLKASHGIQTVINLRGACPGVDWYRDQVRITAELDMSLEDIHLSATRLPSTAAIRHLVDVLERSKRPILIHCHQGADRTGLASAMVLLLRPGIELAEARRQLGLVSGHVSVGRTGHVDHFLDLYERWLKDEGRTHSPALFRTWARKFYCPDAGRARYTLLEPPGPEIRLPAARGRPVKVRCRNTSLADWHFKPGPTAGVHLLWRVMDSNDAMVALGRSGLREATVRPGEHIDVEFVLPPLPPGVHQLHIELNEEQHATFSQLGDEVLCVTVVSGR
jgi:predicted protein tyrosine phosphatase